MCRYWNKNLPLRKTNDCYYITSRLDDGLPIKKDLEANGIEVYDDDWFMKPTPFNGKKA